MNRETIEKAARDYVKPKASIIPLAESIAAKEGFITGAEWRINSAWHDVQKELPAPDETVIAEYVIDGEKDYCFAHRSESPRVSVDKHGFCFYVRGAEIICWAYISDLLPARKEEEDGSR